MNFLQNSLKIMILGISINCRIPAMKSGVLILSKKFNGLKGFFKRVFQGYLSGL